MHVLDGLPAALRQMRERLGCSQAQVEQRGGLPLNSLTRYETGKSGLTLQTLDKILHGAGATLRDLADELDKGSRRVTKGAPDRAAETLRSMVAAFPGEERQERAADAFLRIMESLATAGDMLIRPPEGS